MATQPSQGNVLAFPATLPPPTVMRILRRFDRQALEAFISVAIDLADAMDGDPDAEAMTWPEDIRAQDDLGLPDDSEPVGDEDDGDHAEDEETPRACEDYGPGCPIGDTDFEHDGREEEAGVLIPEYGVDQTKAPLGCTEAGYDS